MTKSQVNYKVISGMRAVGNQCRDCAHHDREATSCRLLAAKVNPKARCDEFSGTNS